MKLNPRERNLAFLFGVVVFILVNLFLLPRLHTGNTQGRKVRAELEMQLTAAQGWVSQNDFWQHRADWIREAQPKLDDPGQETAAQLEQLQQQAHKFGLELRDISLLPLAEQQFYKPVGVRFVASGSWPALVRFLAYFQTPETFTVIPNISIRSDQNPPNILCEMELQRLFQLPES